MRMEEEAPQQNIDITQLYFHFKEHWRNVFIAAIGNEYFIYRALGRQEYYDILESEELQNDYLKEEAICHACLLWPENYNWAECDAGIPTKLKDHILKNSYLDSVTARRAILDHYRQDMYNLDNQITAIICEAFPTLDIEDVEQWDVEKTMKYFSRAEWTLHNLHGIPFQDANAQAEAQGVQPQHEYGREDNPEMERPKRPAPKTQEAEEDNGERTIRGGSRKSRLTPEKLRELQEKYPSIDWAHDNIQMEGIEGMAQSGADSTPPALRVGW